MKWQNILSWLISILIPFFLIITAVRLLLNPLFLQIEYNHPTFPPDPYGFTIQDRLYWAGISLDYLLNSAGIEFLSKQRLADGSPLYNERELRHMLDVKILVQNILAVWYILLIFLVVLFLLAKRGKWITGYWLSLKRGGGMTVGLILLILISVAISFNALFTAFHRVFFEGESWIFRYSDTLIRLFPMRFWQDAFTYMGLFTLLGGSITAVCGHWLARRSSKT
ncbi:MAG: TIGR01906 family membrane protein [Anaerolineales bacterium]